MFQGCTWRVRPVRNYLQTASKCCDIPGKAAIIGRAGKDPAREPALPHWRSELMAEMMLSYIDPGSGSIVLQLVVGSFLGLGLFFRQSVMRFFRLFRRNR